MSNEEGGEATKPTDSTDSSEETKQSGKTEGGKSPQSTESVNVQNEDVDVRDVDKWKDEPKEVTHDQLASLEIARYVLLIFGLIYLFCFISLFCMFRLSDVTYNEASELVKFMLTSVIPLVTLAVGYYLGDRRSATISTEDK